MLLLSLGIQAQTSQNLSVNGTNRSLSVYVPSGLPENAPLMITMHGMSQDVPYHISHSEWEEVADTAKLLVVYPQGIGNRWDISGTSDTDFILAIIDEMSTKYGIDKNRVYLSGFSMGGMMTYHAATKIADHIAAFAPVSGYLMGGPNTNSSRPIPIIHTHGTADDVVGYSGVKGCLDAWIKRNNCPTTAVVTDPYPANKPNSLTTKYYWGKGDDGVEIVHMKIEGKGHWWSEDINGATHTSTEIWKFVSRYSLSSGEPKIAFSSPTTNSLVAPAKITFDVDVSDEDGTVSNVFYYLNDKLIQEEWEAPYGFEYTIETAGKYTVKAVATDNEGKKAQVSMVLNVNVPQAPYGGTPHAVPGIIQLEDYDLGGNGFAYYDTDEGTNVDPDPGYRTDDVDIEVCTDDDGGYNLGWTAAGEWLEYTVNVANSGTYDIVLRASANGDDKTVSLTSDGDVLAENVPITNTLGWQEWTDITITDVELKAGEQVLRLTIGESDFVNLNYMKFIYNDIPLEPIQLKAGWNLIGCPIEGSTELSVALSSIWDNVLIVKDFDSFYMKEQADHFNLLESLEWGKGYFVKVDDDCELEW